GQSPGPLGGAKGLEPAPEAREPAAERRRPLGPLAEALLDARRQRLEVRIARIVRERCAERAILALERLQRLAALRALVQVLLDRQEQLLAGDPVVECAQLLGRGVLHGFSPVNDRRRDLSSARARESRDITVPTGTPSARAMSSY